MRFWGSLFRWLLLIPMPSGTSRSSLTSLLLTAQLQASENLPSDTWESANIFPSPCFYYDQSHHHPRAYFLAFVFAVCSRHLLLYHKPSLNSVDENNTHFIVAADSVGLPGAQPNSLPVGLPQGLPWGWFRRMPHGTLEMAFHVSGSLAGSACLSSAETSQPLCYFM